MDLAANSQEGNLLYTGRRARLTSDTPPMIAISYRRDDSLPIAGRLYDRLQAKFGRENVFMDFDSIPPGVDFREQIKQTIERSKLVIAVIGPRWLGEQSDSSRRIDDPADFVRLEIKYALKQGIPIIPLLVGNTPMPRPEKLPADIEGLAFRNALPLDSGLDFHNHAQRLINGICGLVDVSEMHEAGAVDAESKHSAASANRIAQARRPSRPTVPMPGLLTLIILAGLGLLIWLVVSNLGHVDEPQSQAKTAQRTPGAQVESAQSLTVGPQLTAAPKASVQPPPIASPIARISPSLAPPPTIESQLLGSWQSARLYTEYMADHTFKTIGLYVTGMRWKLDGRTLTQWYPELGDRTPAWYPGAGELSFNIAAIDADRLVLEAKDGRRFVACRLHGDSQSEHEALADKARKATEQEANGADPPDVASLAPVMLGEAYPQTRTRLLSAKELTDWTWDQLQYAINEVYARHGFMFPDKAVQQGFEKMTWYHPRKDLTAAKAESVFSEFEKANVRLLSEARGKLLPLGGSVSGSWTYVSRKSEKSATSTFTCRLVLSKTEFVYTKQVDCTARPGVRLPNAPQNVTRYSAITRYKGNIVLNNSSTLKIKLLSCDFPIHFPKWHPSSAAGEKEEAAYVGAIWTFRRKGTALVDTEDSSTVFEPSK